MRANLARMGRLKQSGITCWELLADLVHFGLDLYIAIWQYSYMEIDGQTDRLSLAFGALADPTRRAILARLASGDADVSELMKPFALSQPTISKHLNVLERAGLVRRGRNAQRRPALGLRNRPSAKWSLSMGQQRPRNGTLFYGHIQRNHSSRTARVRGADNSVAPGPGRNAHL